MRGSRRRGGWAVGAIFLAVLLGLWFTPYDPLAQDFRADSLSGPSWAHWMGVDPLGRDLFSRLWRGTANTVVMSLGAVGGTFALSAFLLAAFERGGRWFERLIETLVNVWVAVPVFFLGLLLLVAFAPSPQVLVMAAALGNVPLAFRQLRVLWRTQRTALYVESSLVLGASWPQLLRHTIWPNLWPDLLGLAKLVFAMAALELSGLAFLGLIGDPDFPELGSILRQHLSDLYRAPLLVVWPGLALSGLLALVHSGLRVKRS
jgi:peptide/nickel transport system permease protein